MYHWITNTAATVALPAPETVVSAASVPLTDCHQRLLDLLRGQHAEQAPFAQASNAHLHLMNQALLVFCLGVFLADRPSSDQHNCMTSTIARTIRKAHNNPGPTSTSAALKSSLSTCCSAEMAACTHSASSYAGSVLNFFSRWLVASCSLAPAEVAWGG